MPFFAQTELDLFRRIQQVKYKIPTTCDENEDDRSISPSVQKLIRRIFVKNASKRITAADILNDPWILNHVADKIGDRQSPLIESNEEKHPESEPFDC